MEILLIFINIIVGLVTIILFLVKIKTTLKNGDKLNFIKLVSLICLIGGLFTYVYVKGINLQSYGLYMYVLGVLTTLLGFYVFEISSRLKELSLQEKDIKTLKYLLIIIFFFVCILILFYLISKKYLNIDLEANELILKKFNKQRIVNLYIGSLWCLISLIVLIFYFQNGKIIGIYYIVFILIFLNSFLYINIKTAYAMEPLIHDMYSQKSCPELMVPSNYQNFDTVELEKFDLFGTKVLEQVSDFVVKAPLEKVKLPKIIIKSIVKFKKVPGKSIYYNENGFYKDFYNKNIQNIKK